MNPKEQKKSAAGISPRVVRYIKLGEGGLWEAECRDKGILRFGFGSSQPERMNLCTSGQWNALTNSFTAEGRSAGTATRFTNEARLFFDDDGTTLWITFICDKLYWGMLSPDKPAAHVDGRGTWRTVSGGWSATDIKGEPLTKDRLSGALTKLASYRGTSCSVDKSKYIIDRINGKKPSEVERALIASEKMKASTLELMRLLEPKDFELLADLVFTTSGWRRLGPVGKTQKTIDINLELPSTGDRAFVQVKSRTTSAELMSYVAQLDEIGPLQRMFYVYHSGEASCDDDRVMVIGPDKLAEMVMNAGLTNWLIEKVS